VVTYENMNSFIVKFDLTQLVINPSGVQHSNNSKRLHSIIK